MKHLALLPALALALAACSDVTAPVDQERSEQSPSFAISDGANDGNEHFFFLPPMVKDPGDLAGGVFNATLSLEVQICVWRLTDEECGPNLEMYTMDTGPGSETVRLNETDELYIVDWHTNDILENVPLGTDEVYRIRVLAEGKELGFADVVVVSSGKELKNVDTDEYIPFKDGRTLPIKFRIEEGALAVADVAVSGGYLHSCAVSADGDAYCWGYNAYGQLGNGTTSSTVPSPVAVVGGHTFASVSAGASHTCGVTTDGDAYCWGWNTYGQLGTGTTSSTVPSPVAVVGGHTFVSVSAGSFQTCGVTTDGDAYCWGINRYGQLGTGTTSWSEPSPVAVVGGHTFVSVSMAEFHTCGVTTDGDAYCWGYNAYGQLGTGTTSYTVPSPVAVVGGHTFASVSAGGAGGGHTCGVTTDGDAYCWGHNEHGKLGTGTTSYSEPSPVAVVGGHTFVSVSMGRHHSCGVTTDGDAYCWGNSGNGQLGNGTTSNSESSPVAVVGGHTFASVSAGYYHTCGVTTDGDAYCWGTNSSGQLGTGTTSGIEPSPEFALDLDPYAP